MPIYMGSSRYSAKQITAAHVATNAFGEDLKIRAFFTVAGMTYCAIWKKTPRLFALFKRRIKRLSQDMHNHCSRKKFRIRIIK